MKIVCQYLNLMEFQIPAFRAFCKTGLNMDVYRVITLNSDDYL